MTVGFIGCGNIANALATGFAQPGLFADPVEERARALAEATGGRVCAGNREVAEQADIVFLCHKPGQLDEVAADIGDVATTVVSVLAGVSLSKLAAAYPKSSAYRIIPSVLAEVRSGAIAIAKAPPQGPDEAVRDLLASAGSVVELPDELIDTAMGLMSVAPAYYALIAEAQIDAGVRLGLTPDAATQLVLPTMEGAGRLLQARGGDTLGVRRSVTSPGGTTARGLDALEKGGLRSAFSRALDAVLGR